MKQLHMMTFFVLVLIIGLTACGAEAVPTAEPPTATTAVVSAVTDPDQATAEAVAPPPTFTLTASPEPTATNTVIPTATPSPTATATPTPEPDPIVKVNEASPTNINVRAGPGLNYPIITQFAPGQEASVTGRNEDDSWWQVNLPGAETDSAQGWVYGQLVSLIGAEAKIAIVAAPPTPTPNPQAEAANSAGSNDAGDTGDDAPPPPSELVEQLRCGKDFCVTYQAMVPIGENGGCVGNHSIYITVLQGLPPGKPLDGIVIGDTFNNVEVGSGSHGPGRTEITLWNNSMTLTAKRHIDGTPYTSEESFNFTAHDELIPAEVLAANGYCDGNVETCRVAQQNNQVCRGHYSWRVTFHKFD